MEGTNPESDGVIGYQRVRKRNLSWFEKYYYIQNIEQEDALYNS